MVLGGSRARGTENPNNGLDIAQFRRVASVLDDDNRDNLITEIGGWGPWINGGGWLKVNQKPVGSIRSCWRNEDQNKSIPICFAKSDHSKISMGGKFLP